MTTVTFHAMQNVLILFIIVQLREICCKFTPAFHLVALMDITIAVT